MVPFAPSLRVAGGGHHPRVCSGAAWVAGRPRRTAVRLLAHPPPVVLGGPRQDNPAAAHRGMPGSGPHGGGLRRPRDAIVQDHMSVSRPIRMDPAGPATISGEPSSGRWGRGRFAGADRYMVLAVPLGPPGVGHLQDGPVHGARPDGMRVGWGGEVVGMIWWWWRSSRSGGAFAPAGLCVVVAVVAVVGVKVRVLLHGGRGGDRGDDLAYVRQGGGVGPPADAVYPGLEVVA